jgi:hypothetical protein
MNATLGTETRFKHYLKVFEASFLKRSVVTEEKYAVFVQVIFHIKFKITERWSTQIFVSFRLTHIVNKRLELCTCCTELVFAD